MSKAHITTKKRILLAAEALYAEKGFEGVSLRDITTSAGVNVSAVSYYFGSMKQLADEIMVCYIDPINERRLELLNKLNGTEAKGIIKLEQVLEAFIRPLLEVVSSNVVQEKLFSKIIGHCMTTSGDSLPDKLLPQFRSVTDRFIEVLQLALPHLNTETLIWRMHFSFGALAHTLTHSDRVVAITNGRFGYLSLEQLLSEIVTYCCGGLRAEAVCSSGKP